MLIVIPKCISSQVMLNDVLYHKYNHHHLQISCQCVGGCKMMPNSSVLCLPQIWVDADIQWYRIVLHDLDSDSTLFYDILLVFSIRLQVSLLPPAKLSDNRPLGKLWQCDRINIIDLNEWCHQKKNTSLESHLLVNIAVPFKIQYLFFKNASKLQLRNMHFQQQHK